MHDLRDSNYFAIKLHRFSHWFSENSNGPRLDFPERARERVASDHKDLRTGPSVNG